MHIALHALMTVVALLCGLAAYRSTHRDPRKLRIGEFRAPVSVVLLGVGAIAPFVGFVAWALISGLMPAEPKWHPAYFLSAAFLAYLGLLIALINRGIARATEGTVTLLDGNTLLLESGGSRAEFTVVTAAVSPGVGDPRFTYAQYELSDGHRTLHFHGALPVPAYRTLSGARKDPTGFSVIGSSLALYAWLQPVLGRSERGK